MMITLVLFVLKLKFNKKLSFVMSVLVCAQMLTLGSIFCIIIQNFLLYKEESGSIQTLFFVAPLLAFLVQCSLNLVMCVTHIKVMKSTQCEVKRLVYIPSVLVGYHWLS